MDIREAALRMLDNNPLVPSEIFHRWDDGFVAAWALIEQGDAPESFEGLRLLVRTMDRRPNVYAMALVSVEQIHDDENGLVLTMLRDRLRRDCERELRLVAT